MSDFMQVFAGYICDHKKKRQVVAVDPSTKIKDVCNSIDEMEIQLGIEDTEGVRISCDFFAGGPTFVELRKEITKQLCAQK